MYFQARKVAFRETKKLFAIAMEGAETEPKYFRTFKPGRDSIIRLKLLPNPKHQSSPKAVLKRLDSFAREDKHKHGDELWIVIDRDAWNESELNEVCNKAGRKGYYVALSNPCFELWLYLHFRDNKHFNNRKICQQELAKVLKGYSPDKKGAYDISVLSNGIDDAIRRAKILDACPQHPWPQNQATRVYKLVEKLRV